MVVVTPCTIKECVGILWQIQSCLVSGDKHGISVFSQCDGFRQNAKVRGKLTLSGDNAHNFQERLRING